MDQETVALVWSFSNKNKDIPYRISRTGKSKKEGGRGVKWSCNCPSFIHRGSKTCKHLIYLKDKLKSGTAKYDEYITLTEYGLDLFV
jgi:hypothetical protein